MRRSKWEKVNFSDRKRKRKRERARESDNDVNELCISSKSQPTSINMNSQTVLGFPEKFEN
jgi:hypothetical protein